MQINWRIFNLKTPALFLSYHVVIEKILSRLNVLGVYFGNAPRLGFEPRTYRLTAGRSAVELSGIKCGNSGNYITMVGSKTSVGRIVTDTY